jgi:two-component system sensor histidine kinase AtoS
VFHLQRIELIGELFNTVKHELNNPLCGVELYLNILDEVVQNDQKFFVNQMNASITRAKNVINTFNNIYSNTTVYSKVKLETILDHALTICKSELKFVYLEKDFKNLESMVINTNENYIIHILFNLLTNAVHAVKENDHEKKITLNLNNAEDGIIIYISDNGQGIPVEIQKTIFNPFFTTKKTGTGLGLAISHYLASQINGNLKLEHSSREGTCFSLYIKDLNDE